MVAKHPNRPQLVVVPPEGIYGGAPNLSKLEETVREACPSVGVSVRGLKPGHIKALFGRFFSDSDKEAKDTFQQLGSKYLDGSLPAWLRRSLSAGLLTPLVKKIAPDGVTPDARPTNARDIDVSLWTKALAKAHTSAVTKRDAPQQLSVDVSNGAHMKVIGTRMKLLVARAKMQLGFAAAICVVFLDLKNAHNEYKRSAA